MGSPYIKLCLMQIAANCRRQGVKAYCEADPEGGFLVLPILDPATYKQINVKRYRAPQTLFKRERLYYVKP